ncbi:MAG TPA: ABC transporter permease subunit [Ornithinibacter sp.]|nr:ABC transporter permease subunit [Ornithinibacter sp.]
MSGQRATVRRRQTAFRWVAITVAVAAFAAPLLGAFDFTTQGPGGNGRTAETWLTLVDVGKVTTDYPALRQGFLASVGLAIVTPLVMLLILVPTMTWVRLRLPGLSRTVEFICLLPLTVPAIVLVVGLGPVYAWVYFLLGSSTLWLSLAYVVLVLPYAYRSLDAGLRAIDVRTLSEAARSLGASWFTVMRRIVLPNLRSAVLSASFLSVALVLGEFTIASLFSKKNLQVAMYELGKSDAKISVAVGLLALVFAFLVLFAMSFVGSSTSGTSPLARLRRSRAVPKEPAA